jgi:AcrR family transcriptional regulator
MRWADSGEAAGALSSLSVSIAKENATKRAFRGMDGAAALRRQWISFNISITMKSAAAPAAEAGRKPRGRPRSFDREQALEQAMEVFWRKGYDATSISDLTEAMGINPPSLYAAFGDKEKLYLEAVEFYRVQRGEHIREVMASEPTARGAIEKALREAVSEFSRRDCPAGCLLTMSTSCVGVSAGIQQTLAKKRAMGRDRMRERIRRGIEEGDVPASADPQALAEFIMTVFAGMAMHARDGASRKALNATVDSAMRAFPEVVPRASKKRPTAAA